MAFKRRHVLPPQTWINGNNIQVPVGDLPALGRIEKFQFRFEATVTAGGGGAVPGEALYRSITMLDIGPDIHANGRYFRALERQVKRRRIHVPADVGAGLTERRDLIWEVPFLDPRAQRGIDDLPVGADFSGLTVSIDTAALGAVSANLAALAGTIRPIVYLLPPNAKGPGARVQFGTKTLTGQAPSIDETALYRDMWIQHDDGTNVTSAQVATAQLQIDGQNYTDVIRHAEYTTEFDRVWSAGSDAAEQFGQVDAAGASSSEILPLMYPGRQGYKKGDLPHVAKSFKLEATGTDVTFVIGFVRYLPHSEQKVVQAFQRRGQTDVVTIRQVGADLSPGDGIRAGQEYLLAYMPLKKR